MMFDLGIIAPVAGAVGLFAALIIYLWLLKQDAGTNKMKAVADEIDLGAMTFIKAEYSKILIFVVVVAGLLSWALSWHTALAFVGGALTSGVGSPNLLRAVRAAHGCGADAVGLVRLARRRVPPSGIGRGTASRTVRGQ